MTNDSVLPADRTVAALTDVMTALDSVGRAADVPGLYLVVSSSGAAYLVDTAEGWCECPDDTYRPVECKHRRHVAFVIGERPIPEWVDPAALDDQFGLHVDADPSRAVADGGVVRTPSDESTVTGSASGLLAVEADDDPSTKRAKREDIDVSSSRSPAGTRCIRRRTVSTRSASSYTTRNETSFRYLNIVWMQRPIPKWLMNG